MTHPVGEARSTSLSGTARLSLFVLFLCYTANQLCAAIISFLAVPIKAELNISDLQFGVITGPGFSFTYGIFAFLFAYYADRGNRVNLLVGVLVLWSIATITCGLVTSFIQLLLARIAVAVGEAGGTPTTLALVSDSVPKARMSTAFSLLMLAAPLGFLISAAAGSFFSGEFGWRATFMACGALGIPIAILMKWKVSEPREFAREPCANPGKSFSPAEIFGGTLASVKDVVGRKSAFMILLAFAWSNYAGGVLPNWLPIFLNRYHGYTAEEAALYFGVAFVGGIVPGLLLGGFLTDRLARRNPMWTVTVPLLAIATSVPLLLASFHIADATLALTIFGVGVFTAQLAVGPILGTFNAGLPSRVRATGSAMLVLGTSLLAGGLGNFTVGALSDLLAPGMGVGSLRIVLTIVIFTFASLACICLLLSRRTLLDDLARVEEDYAQAAA